MPTHAHVTDTWMLSGYYSRRRLILRCGLIGFPHHRLAEAPLYMSFRFVETGPSRRNQRIISGGIAPPNF